MQTNEPSRISQNFSLCLSPINHTQCVNQIHLIIKVVSRSNARTFHALQVKDSHVDAAMYELCENIDAWAMWISPPMFLIFNIAYWLTYQGQV